MRIAPNRVISLALPALLAAAAGLVPAEAQLPAEDTIPVPLLIKVPPRKLYSVSLSFDMAFNLSAQFKNLGSFPPSGGGPGAALPGIDHFYGNGYNRVDVADNNHGGFEGTWYWGYQNPNQISGDTLTMQSSSLAAGVNSGTGSGNPQPGFELTVGRDLGGGHHWRWGAEGGFGFTHVTFDDNRTLTGNVNVVTDAYALNGVIPAVPPYHGTYSGPGAIIGDNPSRTTSIESGAATITGWRELDADLFEVKLGPYVELPLNDYWSVRFRGGLALVEVNSEFSYSETTTLPGVGSLTSKASGWQTSLLVGGYAGGNLSCALSASTRIFAGAEYQNVGNFTQNLNGRTAVLNLSQSIFVDLGLSYSF
jgi:hypothetical protein